MASTREIRRRIRSVSNIAQVTKAMEAVSAAKMRKAQRQVLTTRPYAEQAAEVLAYIARIPKIDPQLTPPMGKVVNGGLNALESSVSRMVKWMLPDRRK